MIRYPRRAKQLKTQSPYQTVSHWEQLTVDGDITVYYHQGEPARSCWDTFDSLLKDNAACGVVEVFDHHYPRYFEVKPSRGLHLRRKFTDATHAVWADGTTPERDLCDAKYSGGINGGYLPSIEALIASNNFIETDANGVALDGSDSTKRLWADDLQHENTALKKKVAALELELYRKDQLAYAFRRDIAERGARIKTLEGEAHTAGVREASLRKEIRSFSECLARADSDVVRLRVERDDWKRKYNEVTDDVTKIFYAVGPYEPIVPFFIAQGELYGSAITRLAREYAEYKDRALRAEGDLRRIREVVAK